MVIMVILLIIVKIKYIKLSKKSLFFCVLFFPKEHVDVCLGRESKGGGRRRRRCKAERDMGGNSVDTFQNSTSASLIFLLGL